MLGNKMDLQITMRVAEASCYGRHDCRWTTSRINTVHVASINLHLTSLIWIGTEL